MFKILIFLLLFFNYLFSYDDPFEDVMNQYLYRENITKLLLVKKEVNIRSCNDIKCDIIRKIPENSIIVSSNLDKFYQIKFNEWISPELIEEIKIYNQKDYLLKKNLSFNNSYILYKGFIKNNKGIVYDIKKEIFLEMNQNLIIDNNNRKINKFILSNEEKNSVITRLNYFNLLKTDLSLFCLFNDLIKDKDFVFNDLDKKSIFDF